MFEENEIEESIQDNKIEAIEKALKEDDLLQDDVEEDKEEWSEGSLGNLLGFDSESRVDTSAISTSKLNKLLEEETYYNSPASLHAVSEPRSFKTKTTFANNPWSKLMLVGGVLGVCFIFGGSFLEEVKKQGASIDLNAISGVKSSVSSPQEKGEHLEPSNQSSDLGVYKTELALSKQQEQLKALNEEQSLVPETSLQLVEEPDVSPPPPPQVKQPPTQQQVKYVSPPPPPPPQYREPPQTPVVPQVQDVAPPPKQKSFAESINQWEQLASLGSYGTSGKKVAASRETNSSNQVNSSPELSQTLLGANSLPRQPIQPEQILTAKPTDYPNSSEQQFFGSRHDVAPESEISSQSEILAEEQRILNRTPVRVLQIGQLAPGNLISPIIWAGESQGSQLRFVAQLTRSLNDVAGREVLREGTKVIFEVPSVHNSGLVNIVAIALIKNGVEYTLPKGAIDLRGKSGQPLIAKKSSDANNEIARRNRTTFVLGALSKVGEVLNRPDISTSTFSSNSTFNQTITSNSGDPDIVGAILSGGLNPVLEGIQERNSQVIKDLLEQPTLWYVEAGEEVQIFVNSSFEL